MNKLENKLLYGDNLTLMKDLPPSSVDLIYLDPPFNSKKTYNLMYKKLTGKPVDEQVEAFCDSWTMDAEKQELMETMQVTMKDYDVDADFIEFWNLWIRALRQAQPKLLAYLLYMTVRLLEMRKLLKPTGSIFYHCDPTASHYIKIIMDGIFGHKNFRNEIIWCYSSSGRSKRYFPRKHDVIFFYSKTDNWFFDGEDIRIPMIAGNTKYNDNSTYGVKVVEKDGKRYRVSKSAGKEYWYDIDKGKIPEDWWCDIQYLQQQAKERLGYETQKPMALLDRIIKAGCPEGGGCLRPLLWMRHDDICSA